MSEQRETQLKQLTKVRQDFANRFVFNFANLQQTSRQQWALFKVLE
jgi:Ca2+-binding EF-hand superfamily protein